MAVWSVVRVSELEQAARLDAEYYQPKYRIDFSQGSWTPVGQIVEKCQYGISQAMTEEPIGCPIFRMDDIKNAFLVDDEVKYITISDGVLERYKLHTGDILFNRVNSEEFVGRTGIFKLSGTYVFASYLIRLSIKPGANILPDYLNVFLNSSVGIRQIRKLSRRAVNQANVNAKELRTIRVRNLPSAVQKEIRRLCDKSFAEFEKSKSVYLRAEQMVLSKLGWDKLDLSQPKSWPIPLSRAKGVHRLDAEHFQPKYDKLLSHLRKTGKAQPLGEIAPYIKRGVQPEYAKDGRVIVVNSQHLGRRLLDVEATERTTVRFWEGNKSCRLQPSDVLLYSTGAYVGRTNAWLESQKAIGSNHVTIIRTNSHCHPLYLAVFLNAQPGLSQTEKWASGSAQREIYPEDIARFLVYLPSEKFQRKVADLVRQAHQLRRKAKSLLGEAKTKVEALIEGKGA